MSYEPSYAAHWTVDGDGLLVRRARPLDGCPPGPCQKDDEFRWSSPERADEARTALLDRHQFAPKYPVVCSCGFSAGFAMDSETPWIHHVAYLLREAGLSEAEPDTPLAIVPRHEGNE